MSSKDGSNKLKRESSILSYFQKVSPEKAHSGFVSAKTFGSQPQKTTSVNRPASAPPTKSNPFGTSGFSSKAISNDSKYINPDLYGDKLVFSSQITAKRTLATDNKNYEFIDLTDSAESPSSPRPTIASNSSGYSKSGSQSSAVSSQPPTNRSGSATPKLSGASAKYWKPSDTNDRNPPKPIKNEAPIQNSWQDHKRYQVPPSTSSSSSSQSQQSPMFGNPALSQVTQSKQKRTMPSNTFSEFKRHRPDAFRKEEAYNLTPIGDYTLSAEQTAVLKMVVFDRKSLFFTGSAGTGKSVLLREIIAHLRRRLGDSVAVTASTGIAACNINGMTLHSFAGIGLGHDNVKKLVEKIEANKTAMNRWKDTTVLVIDEISMIDGVLFDKIEMIARAVKRTSRPFGGIQLILTGDFFQLPPVGKDKVAQYCFEGKSWNQAVDNNVVLTHVFRQKDEEFVGMLNEMRLNQMSKATIEKFKSLNRTPMYKDRSIEPTRLYSLRSQVDAANIDRLQRLTGPLHRYTATNLGDQTKLKGCMAPEELELKLDAQVMLIKNLTQSLVNGSTGIVIGFTHEGNFTSESNIKSRMLDKDRSKGGLGRKEPTPVPTEVYPIVRFVTGEEVVIQPEKWEVEIPGRLLPVASRTQIPLMLAWALSIHKSQGQTLDRVFVDLGSVFEKGQAYVALSRATDINALQVLNFDPAKVSADHRVVEFYRQLSCI